MIFNCKQSDILMGAITYSVFTLFYDNYSSYVTESNVSSLYIVVPYRWHDSDYREYLNVMF